MQKAAFRLKERYHQRQCRGSARKTRPPWQITKPLPPGAPTPLLNEAAYPEAHAKASFWTLAVGSIGVVYGDIGTSPLYAFKESVAAASEGGAICATSSWACCR